MGERIGLRAADGNELGAYVARPEGPVLGAVVVVQEIFGVNAHMRSVADGYAKDGFVAVAPALFDRGERDVELKYDDEDRPKGFALMQKVGVEGSLADVAAAVTWAEGESAGKGVGVVGFCYGGLISWLAATRARELGIAPKCCVGYYAGGIGKVAAEEPQCPVMLHFGGADEHIGPDQINAVRDAHAAHAGEVQVFVYDGAGHAFNRDVGQSYHPAAAKLARERTLQFLKANLG